MFSVKKLTRSTVLLLDPLTVWTRTVISTSVTLGVQHLYISIHDTSAAISQFYMYSLGSDLIPLYMFKVCADFTLEALCGI